MPPSPPLPPVFSNAFRILAAISARGYLAHVVGGAVRDLLLGREVADVDLATDMPLEELAGIFRTVPVGRSLLFETVVIPLDHRHFHVSRHRGGAMPADFRAGAVPPSLAWDLAHRDFTVNAMAMDLEGAILDPLGGRTDLAHRRLRTAGNPGERFLEDPLRILRGVRLAVTLGFTLEEETRAASRSMASRVGLVAPERVAGELLRLAAAPGAEVARGVLLLEETGLLAVILPEVAALRNLPHAPRHHPEGDVLLHTLAALRHTGTDPLLNLATLLHDVGKGATRGAKEDGTPTYLGHDRVGGEMAARIARRFRFSSSQTEALSFAAGQHMRAAVLARMRPSKGAALVGSPHWPLLKELVICDRKARVTSPGEADTLQNALETAEAEIRRRMEMADRALPPLLEGERVMRLTGLTPGPRLGVLIRRARDWALDQDRYDALSLDRFLRQQAASPPAG